MEINKLVHNLLTEHDALYDEVNKKDHIYDDEYDFECDNNQDNYYIKDCYDILCDILEQQYQNDSDCDDFNYSKH